VFVDYGKVKDMDTSRGTVFILSSCLVHMLFAHDANQIKDYTLEFNLQAIQTIYEEISAQEDYYLAAYFTFSLSYVVDGLQNVRGEDSKAYALARISHKD
jgi:hypothetical protein